MEMVLLQVRGEWARVVYPGSLRKAVGGGGGRNLTCMMLWSCQHVLPYLTSATHYSHNIKLVLLSLSYRLGN